MGEAAAALAAGEATESLERSASTHEPVWNVVHAFTSFFTPHLPYVSPCCRMLSYATCCTKRGATAGYLGV